MKRLAGLGLLLLALGLPLSACGGSGMGKGVREDISARMAAAQEPISACYASALQRNRKLQGRMLVSFKAAAKTGQFEEVRVTRNGVHDDDLQQCVVTQVSALKLEKPQKTAVAVEYPVDFAPSN